MTTAAANFILGGMQVVVVKIPAESDGDQIDLTDKQKEDGAGRLPNTLS